MRKTSLLTREEAQPTRKTSLNTRKKESPTSEPSFMTHQIACLTTATSNLRRKKPRRTIATAFRFNQEKNEHVFLEQNH